MMKKYTNFIAIDVETTGLNDDSEIIEVGLAIVENGTVARTWQSLVRPQKRIPKDIAIMTGITNEMVADAPLRTNCSPFWMIIYCSLIIILSTKDVWNTSLVIACTTHGWIPMTWPSFFCQHYPVTNSWPSPLTCIFQIRTIIVP